MLNGLVKNLKIHFIGIAGIGMSGIALLLKQRGAFISGSDLCLDNEIANNLSLAGIELFLGHNVVNIENKSIDVVVVSSAISVDNIEIVTAKKLGIPVIKRAQALAELMRFEQGITIAGTHGKTTTTSILASIFETAKLDPTVVVGGQIKSTASQVRVGSGEFFIAEADESDGSFLYLSPIVTVITSLDCDHMEKYNNSITKLDKVFLDFIDKLPFYGKAVINLDDVGLKRIAPNINRSQITYGFNQIADYYIKSVEFVGWKVNFIVVFAGYEYSFTLNQPGKYNVQNAVAAIAVARQFGVDWDCIINGVAKFSGVKRRLDFLAEVNLFVNAEPVSVIDDYGHHPVAIKATLQALRKIWPLRRLVVCFEPHRYSRLHYLLQDFIKELSMADCVIMLPVYSCGELPIDAVDSCYVSQQLVVQSYYYSGDDLAGFLRSKLCPGDVLLAQGAGSISKKIQQVVDAWQQDLGVGVDG